MQFHAYLANNSSSLLTGFGHALIYDSVLSVVSLIGPLKTPARIFAHLATKWLAARTRFARLEVKPVHYSRQAMMQLLQNTLNSITRGDPFFHLVLCDAEVCHLYQARCPSGHQCMSRSNSRRPRILRAWELCHESRQTPWTRPCIAS